MVSSRYILILNTQLDVIVFLLSGDDARFQVPFVYKLQYKS